MTVEEQAEPVEELPYADRYRVRELTRTMKLAYAFLYGCMHCGTCSTYYTYEKQVIQVCPSYWRYRFMAYSGGGKMFLLRLIHEGVIDWTQDLAEVVYHCTTCGNCAEICNSLVWSGEKFNTVRLIELMRAELAERGLMPKPHQVFVDYIERMHNPYGEPHEKRFSWLPPEVKLTPDSDTAYFVGCTAAYRRQEIATATAKLLHRLNIPFTVLSGEEWCCGSPALRVGKRELFRQLAKHNVEAIEKAGIKRVVTSCAGCYRSLKQDYPQFIGELPFEVVHSSELLSDLLGKGKLKLSKPLNITATYHDPCHLGRHCKVYDPPRKVLKALPGVKYVELERSREATWCCGAGGGVKAAYPDFALWTAQQRLKEVEESGADTIVSTCPFCSHNIKDAIEKSGSDLAFYDLTELVLRSLEG